MNSPFPISLAFLAALLLFAPLPAHSQPLSPETLKRLNFNQHLGNRISLDLQFRDETGQSVHLRDYFNHNKPVILVMGYYGCPMLCTFVLNGVVSSLQDLPWDIGKQFEIVNVSIDPREGPELAAAKKRTYVKRYGHVDASAGWHFLTGEEPAIRQLASEVGFEYAYDSTVNQYAHPSGLIILSPQGQITRYLSGVVYSTQQLNDALTEASKGKVGSPIKQFFLLCFHYSPLTSKYANLILISVRTVGVTVLGALVGGIAKMVLRERAKQKTSQTPP